MLYLSVATFMETIVYQNKRKFVSPRKIPLYICLAKKRKHIITTTFFCVGKENRYIFFCNNLPDTSCIVKHVDIYNLMFQAIYRAIDEYQVGTDPSNIIPKLEKYFSEAPQSNCGNLKDALLKCVKPKR